MSTNKDRIACVRCGWDGAVRMWGGRFPPYRTVRAVDDVTDPMKRPRALPSSWVDGVCAYCRWRERQAA